MTDFQKRLMSVGQVCDAWYKIVFDKNGGLIQHETTGQKTYSSRVDSCSV